MEIQQPIRPSITQEAMIGILKMKARREKVYRETEKLIDYIVKQKIKIMEEGGATHIEAFQTAIEISTDSQDLELANICFEREKGVQENLGFEANWEKFKKNALRRDILIAFGLEEYANQLPPINGQTISKPESFAQKGDDLIFLVRTFRPKPGGWVVLENLVIASSPEDLEKYCSTVLAGPPRKTAKA